MTTEALLAYAHILAFLTLVVFVSSEAALCRPEWLNATIVERLVTVDRIYGIAAGRLVEVLAAFAAPPNGIYAVFPQRKHLPVRVRLWIEFLKQHFGQPEFWRTTPAQDNDTPSE